MPIQSDQQPQPTTEHVIPLFAPRYAQPEARPRMLFAAVDFVQALPALRRAQTLADRTSAELFALEVPAAGTQSATAHAATTRNLMRACNHGLRARLASDHILQREGDFTKVVAHTARSLAASLVVIAGGPGARGKRVVQIANATEVPVLVSRRSNHGRLVLAALDLHPVGDAQELALGAELAERLAFRLALVHNVQPIVHAMSSPDGHTSCALITPSRARLAESRAQLQALAANAGIHADAIVSSAPSTEDAIVSSARAQGAELIVVGLRSQGFFERLFHTALAMRVVDRTDRSVLVTPLAA